MGGAIARVALTDVAVVTRWGTGGKNTHIMRNYRLIPAKIFVGYNTVVNCVWAISGSDDELATANVEAPLTIVQTAAGAGAGMFVQISSFSFSVLGAAPLITRAQKTAPAHYYGQTKLRAEQALQKLSPANLKLAIITFPMLYG